MTSVLDKLSSQSLSLNTRHSSNPLSGTATDRADVGTPKFKIATNNTAYQVDISDRAKQLYQQAKDNQFIVDKLQSILDDIKGHINSTYSGKSNDDDISKTKIGNNSDTDNGGSVGMQLISKLQKKLVDQHRQKDGTVSSYDLTVRDVSMVPSTPNEKDFWYKTDGADFVAGAMDADSPDRKEMLQAIRERRISFSNASDVADLNYHNKIVIQGGEGGGSAGLSRTYNTNSAIFKDPSRGYFAMDDGTLISWDKTNSTQKTV